MRGFRLLRIALPVAIGVGLTAIMFHSEFNPEAFAQVRFTWKNIVSAAIAVILMFGRDLGQSWRMRLMCRPHHLSWVDAFKENLLCEFTSATTPSAVGGSSLIPVFLKGFGIPAGKGVAITVSTVFLDELFFILICPVMLFFFTSMQLFGSYTDIFYIFIPVYIATVLWTIGLYVALFHRPDVVSGIMIGIFSMRLLRRWRYSVKRSACDLRISAAEMKNMSASFWLKAFTSTAVAWTCRFLVAGALLFPFIPFSAQPLAFARQLVMWLVMIVSPTPGGSGVSEFVFSKYYAGMVSNSSIILMITCLWRLITYYVYLAGGMILLPNWITKFRK
jgi:glycosyltransferase 2 family protein